jgi:ABC-type amino acid transport substrate-binding protein
LLLLALSTPAVAQPPLRVVARDFEPFCYLDAEGEPAGVEYEILQYFAAAQGRELEFVWVEAFADLLPRFDQGDLDIAAGTVTITPARAEVYDFSASYFPVRVHLAEPAGQSTAQLADLAGETLVTMPGTTYEAILEQIPDVELVYAGDENEELAMVARGEGRATALDSVLGLIYVPNHPELHMTLPLSDVQHYGFVVAKGSPLAAQLSKHLNQLKLAGIYFRILEKYMGQEAVEMVRAARE